MTTLAEAYERGVRDAIRHCHNSVITEPEELAGYMEQHNVLIGLSRLENPYKDGEPEYRGGKITPASENRAEEAVVDILYRQLQATLPGMPQVREGDRGRTLGSWAEEIVAAVRAVERDTGD
jgi:hypothetical protein